MFFKRFPSWLSIYAIDVGSLENILKPLGIWRRRASALKSLSKKMLEIDEEYPTQREAIESLPAVGQYVANAIELFEKGLPRPLLDTSMARIMERYFRPRTLSDIRHDPWLQAITHFVVRQSDPVEINWALLDLGALVCKPRAPLCDECPLRKSCKWRKGLGSK